jgi:hypothetical protein
LCYLLGEIKTLRLFNRHISSLELNVIISKCIRNSIEESKYLKAKDKRIITDLRLDPAPFNDSRRV